MHVITVIGHPGSGKSTALSVADDLGIPHITMGDVVRDRAQEALGPDADSGDIGQWATEQRAEHGYQVMAEYTVDRLESDPEFMHADTVVVEGVRGADELSVLRDLGEITCIYIYADPATRLERLVERGRNGEDKFTMQDLAERDHREAEWGVRELVSDGYYDVRVDNTGSKEAFEQTLTDLFSRIAAQSFDRKATGREGPTVATPDCEPSA